MITTNHNQSTQMMMHTNANIKVKLLTILSLLMLVVGNAWADSFSIVASDYSSTNDLLTALRASSGISNGNVTVHFSNNDSDFEADDSKGQMAIKMRGNSSRNATITVSTRSSSITVDQVLITYTSTKKTLTSANATLTTDDEAHTYTFSYSSATSLSIVNSDGNLYITRIDITYTDGRSELSPAFDWSKMEIHNVAGDQHTYVTSSTFVYDSSKDRLKFRLTVVPRYTGIYGTISSSDATVLKTDEFTMTGPTATTVGSDEAWEIYIDNIKVLKTGTATLSFWFNGNDDYKPTTLNVPITVIDHTVTSYSGSYAYTWDFSDGDWASSVAQLGYATSDGLYNWTKTIDETHAEARPTYHSEIPSYSGIDIISGLTFNLSDKNNICLDWFTGRKAVWLANGSSVTIPNLVVGQKITITADGNNFSVTSSNATLSSNVITVTSAGSVTIQMTADTRIQSIAVSNSQYGWTYTTDTRLLYHDKTTSSARPVKGTFTFTDEGPISGGTVIDEVPGVTMTVGVAGDNWEIQYLNETAKGKTYDLGYSAYCPTGATRDATTKVSSAGCFFKFEPKTNGLLTVKYYTVNEVFVDVPEDDTATKQEGTRIQEKSITVEAGKTYYLTSKGGGFWLHSFSFEPKFFQPGTKTVQLSAEAAVIERDGSGNITAAAETTLTSSAFNANMSTGKVNFPKLINPSSTEQQSGVKFADTDRKTYLYKNNDVDLLKPGTLLLIRGTVLDKNGDDGLVAYYYLNSNIISLKSTELEDQVYINSDGLTDDKYTFTFDGSVVASGGTLTVKVKTDTGAETDVIATVNSYDSSNDETKIDIPFASLEEGSTYRIRIQANTLQLSSSSDTKNSEVVRTFSVNKAAEATVKMIYPTAVATVGTTIVLEVLAAGEEHHIFDNPRIKGILSAAGEEDMVIAAGVVPGHLYFKPTRTLTSNTEYTLTINTEYEGNDNRIKVNKKYSDNPDVYYMVTKNKTFTFKTGSSSGSIPKVVTSSPEENAVNTDYSSGEILFTFNQEVELEPYSTVTATPVNGREATANAQTFDPGNEGNTLKLKSDGKTVYFEYGTDDLRYDVYYNVIIPANTVIGAGGLPNADPITLHFRMGQKPSSSCKVSSTAFTGYPYSWDFTKFGILTSSATDLESNAPNPTIGTSEEKKAKKAITTASRWQTLSTGEYANYWTNSMEFPQGEVLTYRTATAGTPEEVELAETRGLRWSMSSRNSSGTDKRIQIATYGTGKVLKMVGGTHYLTIPELTSGKVIYIRASVNSRNVDSRFNINSDNAVFLDNYQSGNNKCGVRDGSTHVYPVNVTGDGDVVFCLQDVTFYQIGVAEDEKTFKPAYVVGEQTYASDRLGYDVRYDLLNTFTGGSVKAYYVSGVTNNEENTTATITATEVSQVNAVAADQGVLVLYQGAVGSNTTVPVFAADVNTAALDAAESGATLTNKLKVIAANSTAFPAAADGYYNYVLSSGGIKGGGVGFYRYTGTTFSPRAAYLPIRKEFVEGSGASGSGAKTISLVFIDDDGVTTRIENVNVNPNANTNPNHNVNGNQAVYDLTGRKVADNYQSATGNSTLPKGIYIVNGKKIVIK